jgi:hypothetical protein
MSDLIAIKVLEQCDFIIGVGVGAVIGALSSLAVTLCLVF